MLDLAQHPDEGYISLKTVAERQDISMKYLEAIVGALKKAGLVDSSRGKEGGYSLLRPPEEYSVGEILRSTEDKLAPVSCITAEGVACRPRFLHHGGGRLLRAGLRLSDPADVARARRADERLSRHRLAARSPDRRKMEDLISFTIQKGT